MATKDDIASPNTVIGLRSRPRRTPSGEAAELAADERARTISSLEVLTADDDDAHTVGRNVLLGLSVAGVASMMLTTIFDMFHVDLFLNSYGLPLSSYSIGSAVFAVISTVSAVFFGWLTDHLPTSGIGRSDITGISGCIFALCFLAPFFRWFQQDDSIATTSTTVFQGGLHFVISTSLFDAMRSFTLTLLGAVVNDNHHMTDKDRVNYMVSGKICSFIASFVVARIGLSLFDTNNLHNFQMFLLALALLIAIMFLVGQAFISGKSISHRYRNDKSYNRKLKLLWAVLLPHRHLHADDDEDDDDDDEGGQQSTTDQNAQKLRWRQIVQDFWTHKNFKAWVVMEMLLEAQVTFITYFLKTFVDRLLLDEMGRQACDWMLSIIRPLTQMCSILAYIPIRRLAGGYPRVYKMLFTINAILSLAMLSVASRRNTATFNITNWTVVYLVAYPVITGAVQDACFHLAQADMVMEMKRKHKEEGRYNQPSLAGLFLGANALLCQPVKSILPITAASILQDEDYTQQSLLFFLLVIPPLVCSCLQLLSFRRYDLTPARTGQMRDELKGLPRHYNG